MLWYCFFKTPFTTSLGVVEDVILRKVADSHR
jgi:hypothetical protein